MIVARRIYAMAARRWEDEGFRLEVYFQLSILLGTIVTSAWGLWPFYYLQGLSFNSTSSRHLSVNRGPESCPGFPGHQDMCGPGIRIGTYLQFITTAIVYVFVPSEATTMRVVNNCFQGMLDYGFSPSQKDPTCLPWRPT